MPQKRSSKEADLVSPPAKRQRTNSSSLPKDRKSSHSKKDTGKSSNGILPVNSSSDASKSSHRDKEKRSDRKSTNADKSSSSKHKNKDKKDGHHSSKDKDKDRHRDKDRHSKKSSKRDKKSKESPLEEGEINYDTLLAQHTSQQEHSSSKHTKSSKDRYSSRAHASSDTHLSSKYREPTSSSRNGNIHKSSMHSQGVDRDTKHRDRKQDSSRDKISRRGDSPNYHRHGESSQQQSSRGYHSQSHSSIHRSQRNATHNRDIHRYRPRENERDRHRDRHSHLDNNNNRHRSRHRDRSIDDSRHRSSRHHGRGESPTSASRLGIDLSSAVISLEPVAHKSRSELLKEEKAYKTKVEQELKEMALRTKKETEEERVSRQRKERMERLRKLKEKKQREQQQKEEQATLEQKDTTDTSEDDKKSEISIPASKTSPLEDHESVPSELDESEKTEGIGEAVNEKVVTTNGAANGTANDTAKKEDKAVAAAPQAYDLFSTEVTAAPVIEKSIKHRGMENLHLTDNWDDSLGYYVFKLHDIIHNRYEVFHNQGKGVFSSVLRVRDVKEDERAVAAAVAADAKEKKKEYVIKVIRNGGEEFLKSGLKEIGFLLEVIKHDRNDTKHCVRLLDHFEHRKHLCLVFEPMECNLRQLLKKVGAGKGFSIDAVRRYAVQLFKALKLLSHIPIIHSDIKPDNMLVAPDRLTVKLCDFGSGFKPDDVSITTVLQSRFYRAPEICVGILWGCDIDMWSMGCCLYELYSGKILFPGEDNNQMLKLQSELCGKYPAKVGKTGMDYYRHFNDRGEFLEEFKDPVSGIELKQPHNFTRPTRDWMSALHPHGSHFFKRMPAVDKRKVLDFQDLLERIFVFDPNKRITPEQALKHVFCVGRKTIVKPVTNVAKS